MHAKYGPSSMARIMACPASVELSLKAPPEPESEYAADGTRAHARAEQLIFDGESDIECEDPEAVDVYVKWANDLLDKAEAEGDRWGVETLVRHNDELFGTTDLWALVGRTLHVADYKHGAGVKVSPVENKQGLTYAGLLLFDQGLAREVDEVIITIAQPRAHGTAPIEHWAVPVERVLDHLESVHQAIAAAKSDNPPIKMGEHCRFCKAKLICPAVEKAQQGILDWDERDLAPDDLAEMLEGARAVEEKLKALFRYAHGRMEAGERVPGWKLVAKRANRKWTNEAEVLRLARRWGLLTKLRPTKLVSPAQAAKILRPEQYDRLPVESVSSGTTVRPESDPAPAVENPIAGLAALGELHR